MKAHILPAIKLTIVCVVIFVVFYSGVIWGVARVAAPNHGKGEVILKDRKIIGFTKIGQSLTSDKYFWSRPSAVNYNAAGSGGSNKGPTNPDYLAEVEKRISDFLAKNPDIKREDIPVELVTASGSGLDPHLSLRSALIQVPRIAKARGASEDRVMSVVAKKTESIPFGPSTLNVLELNLELDKMN